MVKLYVQYAEDGTITGTNISTGEAPPHPRQLIFDLTDKKNEGIVVDGMRVDLKAKKLIPCPLIAKQRHNAGIINQLQVIDAATPRALRDFFLTGDKSALQNLEAQAAKLRPQLKKD